MRGGAAVRVESFAKKVVKLSNETASASGSSQPSTHFRGHCEERTLRRCPGPARILYLYLNLYESTKTESGYFMVLSSIYDNHSDDI